MQGSPKKSLKLAFCSPPLCNYPDSQNYCFIYISKTYFEVLVFSPFFPYCYSFTEDLGFFTDVNITELKQFVNVTILQLALIHLCYPTSCHFNSKFIFLKGFSTGEGTGTCVGMGKDVFTHKWKHFENIEPRHFISWECWQGLWH